MLSRGKSPWGPVWVDMFYSWKDQGKLPPSIKLALLAPGMPGQPDVLRHPGESGGESAAGARLYRAGHQPGSAGAGDSQAVQLVSGHRRRAGGAEAGCGDLAKKLFAEISPEALAKYGKSFPIAPTLTISKRVTKPGG